MTPIKRIIAYAGFASILATPSPSIAQEFVDLSDLIDDDDLSEEGADAVAASVADPIEGVNRAIFAFNDAAYSGVVEPFTKGYTRVVPKEARKGIHNFFENLEYPVRLTGSLLQFKFGRATQETGKFLVNTTAGLGGFMDAAKEYDGLTPPKEDIGQAFGAWGVKHGFYIVLPFVGPTSLRDLVGNFGDSVVDPISEPWSQIDDDTDRFALRATELVNELPEIIDLYNTVTDSAIDPYIAMRDAYAQLRAAKVAE